MVPFRKSETEWERIRDYGVYSEIVGNVSPLAVLRYCCYLLGQYLHFLDVSLRCVRE